MKNLLSNIPTDLAGELVERLIEGRAFRVEQIVSRGHVSPLGFWYDQPEEEWVLVLQGSAKLRFEGEETLVQMDSGDCVEIPAHRRHRVEWTDPDQDTVWLAIHYTR
jgi:cupin 2 domain-containing protein